MIDIQQILIASVKEILSYNFIGNSVEEYLIALVVFVLVVLILRTFRSLGIKKLEKIAKRTKTELDDLLIKIIKSIGWMFYIVLALYFSIQFLKITESLERVLYYILLVVAT